MSSPTITLGCNGPLNPIMLAHAPTYTVLTPSIGLSHVLSIPFFRMMELEIDLRSWMLAPVFEASLTLRESFVVYPRAMTPSWGVPFMKPRACRTTCGVVESAPVPYERRGYVLSIVRGLVMGRLGRSW